MIESRETFVEMVDAFTAVIGRRHDAMLEYLAEPRTIAEMAEHRFIYRPHVEMAFLNSVERNSARMHVDRMLRRGEASESRARPLSAELTPARAGPRHPTISGHFFPESGKTRPENAGGRGRRRVRWSGRRPG